MMWNNSYWYGNNSLLGASLGGFIATLLIPLMVWSIFWKGWALWRAAKNDSKPWFIALLVVNTMGILEILYLFVFGRPNAKAKAGKQKK